jgi:hypothetical protein
MDSPESQSYTVLKRLHIKDLIKNSAIRLLVTINRKGGTDIDSQFERFSKIKTNIDQFRSLRRAYKQVNEPNMIDELGKSFNSLIGHVTDVKDMIIDQNEWYEEIFYGDQDSNSSQSMRSEIYSIGLSSPNDDPREFTLGTPQTTKLSKFADHHKSLAEQEGNWSNIGPRNRVFKHSKKLVSPGDS